MAITSGTGVWINNRVHKQTWAAIPNGNQGSALSNPGLNDKTVQILGTFGAGGTVVIEGSNDGGTTWATLNDSRGEGSALSFTAANIVTILENPERIRPNVTSGDGTTAITVIIVSVVGP